MDIKGHVVHVLWIERASDIAEEYYASFTLDRAAKKHLGMLSAQGGVEIEAVAEKDPDAIAKIWIDPVDGLSEEQARAWVEAAKLNPKANDGAVDILLKLYRAYVEGDADLVEINPLILKPTGEVHALDAKVTLDGNAVFRHPDYEQYDATQVRDEREQAAHEKGLQYVGLDGYVGVIANGAGLAMSTVDIVNQVGGQPANFLDIGGGANADVMTGALEVINNDPERAVDPHQHLRWHHEGRRGRQRHRGRARSRRHRVADRHPPRRHERRRGPSDPRTASVRPAADAAHHARRRSQGSRACRSSQVSIFVDENTKVVYQGLTGSQGRFYGLLNRGYGTQVVAGTNPKKAGTDVDGIPIHASVADAVKSNRRDSVVHLHPCARREGCGARSGRGRRRVHRVHHRGRARAGRGVVLQQAQARLPARAAARTELSWHHQPRQVQHRHHRWAHRTRSRRQASPQSESSAARARSPTRRSTS